MKELKEIRILKNGGLKYDRLKSISTLRHELNHFGFNYTIKEVKDIFEKILNDSYSEVFDRKFQYCIDLIFFNNSYEMLERFNPSDDCFPENYIMPTAY